jgi:hypothetical protein
MTRGLGVEEHHSFSTWLFNPFHYIAGGTALAVGLIAIVVAGLISSLSHSHFDGVMDFHTGLQAPLWFHVAEGIISWFVLSCFLLMMGWLTSKSRIRVIDVFGTQALARTPSLLAALAAMLPGYQHQIVKLISMNLDYSSIDFVVFVFASITIMAATIWMVVLMYRAYSIACNVRGFKGIAAFIVAIVIVEIITKMSLYVLLEKM